MKPVQGSPGTALPFGPPVAPSATRKWLGIIAGAIGLVSAYVGIFGFVVPRVSLDPLHLRTPSDPYSFYFKAQNQGFLPLIDVRYMCVIPGALLTDQATWDHWNSTKSFPSAFDPAKTYKAVRYSDAAVVVLNEKGTLKFVNIVVHTSGPKITNLLPLVADGNQVCEDMMIPDELRRPGQTLSIEVSYRPAYYPLRVASEFDFELASGPDSSFVWIPVGRGSR
jgi:hypothetical protein